MYNILRYLDNNEHLAHLNGFDKSYHIEMWTSCWKCLLYLTPFCFLFCFVLKALHLIDEMDLNSDRKLSDAEILEHQDLFLTSEATDYGRQLHDEYFYHDEL